MRANRSTATRVAALVAATLLVAACTDSIQNPTTPSARDVVETSALSIEAGAILAYVGGSRNVSVVYDAANQVIATDFLGGWSGGIALTPGGGLAYVTNVQSNAVNVVDTRTNQAINTILVQAAPWGIAMAPDGRHAYVANSGSNSVSVISTVTNAVVATIGVARSPHGIAVNPDGAFVYVTALYSDTVSVISTAMNTVVARVPVGRGPWGITVTPDGLYVYVANSMSDSVSIFRTDLNTIVSTIFVCPKPRRVAVTPDGRFVYAACDMQVAVISTATNTVVATIPLGAWLRDVAITPDGARAYVTYQSSAQVAAINTATNTVERFIPVSQYPDPIAIAQVAVPPSAHRPPPKGQLPGIAEKAFVEVCNTYSGGFGPSANVHVLAHVLVGTEWRVRDDYRIVLADGVCRDVWLDPLNQATRVTVIEVPPVGYTPACASTQIGPGSRRYPARPCATTTQAVVFTTVDVGHMIEFTNR